MDRKHKKQRSLKLIQRIILSNKLMGGGNKKKNRKDCEYIKEQLEKVSASEENMTEDVASDDIGTVSFDTDADKAIIESFYRTYTKDSGKSVEFVYHDYDNYLLIIRDASNTYECSFIEFGEISYRAAYDGTDIIEIYNDKPARLQRNLIILTDIIIKLNKNI